MLLLKLYRSFKLETNIPNDLKLNKSDESVYTSKDGWYTIRIKYFNKVI